MIVRLLGVLTRTPCDRAAGFHVSEAKAPRLGIAGCGGRCRRILPENDAAVLPMHMLSVLG